MTAFWIVSFFLYKKKFSETKLYFQTFLPDFVLISCVIFVSFYIRIRDFVSRNATARN